MLNIIENNEQELFDDNRVSNLDEMKEVLIVDDSKTMRKMVISVLSCFDDFKCIEAGNGIEALKKIKNNNIRLIILDYNMPHMDGIEFMQELRKDKELKRIPIIMLTTEKEENKMIKGYVAGARVYLTKPFQTEELIKIVETIRYWHIN